MTTINYNQDGHLCCCMCGALLDESLLNHDALEEDDMVVCRGCKRMVMEDGHTLH